MADPSSMVKIDSIQTWDLALQEIRRYGICGLDMETDGLDPLTSKIRLVRLALPNGRVYLADIFNSGKEIVDDLAVLFVDSQVMKVIYDAKIALSFIRASQGHRLKFKNIFDVMLASQLCWSGYYDLVPSKSVKNPWKKRIPDHSLEALAERHLGIILDRSSRISDWEVEGANYRTDNLRSQVCRGTSAPSGRSTGASHQEYPNEGCRAGVQDHLACSGDGAFRYLPGCRCCQGIDAGERG